MNQWPVITILFVLICFLLLARSKHKQDRYKMESRLDHIEYLLYEFLHNNQTPYIQDNIIIRDDQEIIKLIHRGEKAKAIKLMKDRYQLEIHEAKEIIAHMRGKTDTKTNHNKINDKMDIELIKLIQQGNKIEAIKRVRKQFKYGLKEAKEFVDRLEENTDNKLNPIDNKEKNDNELIKLIQHGNRIQAIKHARQMYGCGLKEAKELVDQLDWKIH